MKKIFIILVLFFPILISFNSYGVSSDITICVETDAQNRSGVIYLPNQTEPFSGNNLCEYENGQIKTKGTIKDGKADGKHTEWFKDGHMRSESNYKDGNELVRVKYKNGWKQYEINYKDGKAHGKFTAWHQNGQIDTESIFKDGKQDGISTSWYENGQIEVEHNHKDGKAHGKWTSWHQNGQIGSVSYHKNGVSVGKWTSWDENGQIWHEWNLKDGKKDGKWTYWYKNGQIEKEATFVDDKCISGDCLLIQ